jgi:hypothetical protein
MPGEAEKTMLPRLLKPVLAAFVLASNLPAQEPPSKVDLSKFPAASVDDVVVPVPSEVFLVLDKLGSPNWRSELFDNEGTNTGNRAQVALLLGTVIADGFIAVQAEDPVRVKEIGQDVLTLSDAIGVRKAVLARSKSITEKADARKWAEVRREFDGALQDVQGAMEELGDHDLAQLVSVGGWVRGTQVLTSVVSKDYSGEAAELLNQPALLDYFARQMDELRNPRLKKEALVSQVRRLLKDLRPIIARAESGPISQEQVGRVNRLTGETVVAIRKGEG